MSKFCVNCGKEIQENQLFCNSCGTGITDKTPQKTTYQEFAIVSLVGSIGLNLNVKLNCYPSRLEIVYSKNHAVINHEYSMIQKVEKTFGFVVLTYTNGKRDSLSYSTLYSNKADQLVNFIAGKIPRTNYANTENHTKEVSPQSVKPSLPNTDISQQVSVQPTITNDFAKNNNEITTSADLIYKKDEEKTDIEKASELSDAFNKPKKTSAEAEKESTESKIGKIELLSELKKANEYFSVRLSDYNMISTLEKQYNEIGNVTKASDVMKFGFKGVAMFLFATFIFMLLGWETCFFITLLISAASMLIIIGGIVLAIIDNSNDYKRWKKFDSQKDQVEAKAEKLFNELKRYHADYPDCPVSFEYSYPPTIEEVISLISSGRADSLKEAIQCMIDDEYKEKMLGLQAEAAKNAKEAANAASSARLFAGAAFLRR